MSKAKVSTTKKTATPKPAAAPATVAKKGGAVQKAVALAVNGPPTATAPATPADYQPLGGPAARRLRKPISDQVSSAESVAGELERSKTYVDDFGSKAVSPSDFAGSLRVAGAWSAEAAHARAWATFAENCASLAWDTALGALDKFKNDFKTGVGHDASIPRRYPELSAFVGARGAVSAKSAATRKRAGKKPPTTPAA